MTSAVPLVLRILAQSASATVRASACIREVMKSGQLGIVEKGKNDLQTAADRGAQRIITGNLRAAFPGLAVIGEEEEDPAAAPLIPGDELVPPQQDILDRSCPAELAGVALEDITVWVDPLDGTSEFADNLLDHVTILVGLAVGKRAVGGVICQPYYNYQSDPANMGRLIWSLEGLGVFGLEAAAEAAAPPGNVIATTRSHSNQTVNDAVAACEPTEVLRVGGCGHKVLLLIERKAHAYVFASPGCKKWDTCAPEAVLRGLGGCLTDIHGNELPYDAAAVHPNRQGVLATLRREDHARFAARIPESVRKALP